MIRTVHGKTPRIHPSCFISEACYITGDVQIGESSSVWPCAVIRGDYGRITIGRRTVIQDTCVIHTDDFLDIGDDVQVTHGAVVHGRRVGNNVLIGINAVVLEEAEIGSYCILGAGAVVRARAKVPDGSLVLGGAWAGTAPVRGPSEEGGGPYPHVHGQRRGLQAGGPGGQPAVRAGLATCL